MSRTRHTGKWKMEPGPKAFRKIQTQKQRAKDKQLLNKGEALPAKVSPKKPHEYYS